MKHIIYKNRTPEASNGFYHKDSPLLFAEHDQITSLGDCPFPIKTEWFEVVLFGKSLKVEGDSFAVVKYAKSCGHEALERIPFQEGVKDFEHFGEKFVGSDYSIKNWENRIDFFKKTLPCDVCKMVRHSIWIWEMGEGGNSKTKHKEQLLFLLDYNFENWEDFVSRAEIDKRFKKVKKER